MNQLSLSFICHSLNLPAPEQDAAVARIVTDSREVAAGDVFVALAGERFDAHDFVAEVLARGAVAAIVSRTDCAALSGCLKVDDTLQALQKLAHDWRMQMKPFVFGITGSSGKTTVKEMLAAILRHHFGAETVLATAGNFNNHIGLPLTLLSLKPQHRFAVIEMGMSHAGELAGLTRIACPDVALVNNALRAHVGCGFAGVSDIARAKSEIYQGLGQSGLAWLPAESPYLTIFQAVCLDKVMQTFGAQRGDLHAQEVALNPLSSRFVLAYEGKQAWVELPAPGLHNVYNACAAAALALSAGLDLTHIAAGLATFSNIKGRLQLKQGANGSQILDDTYNANPDSMKAALDVLAQMPSPRLFVMGDIGELGEDNAAAMHAEVGVYARTQDLAQAYFLGRFCAAAASAFGEGGQHFENKPALIAALKAALPQAASVLVKGSRFMKMEEVVEALLKD